VQVSGTTWNSVAAARGIMAATRTNGTLYTWGAGSFGGLGTSSTIYKSSPTQVGALTNWNIISGAFPGILAIKTDGTLWRWGNNGQGQLGTNDTAYRSSPVQLGTNTNWSSSDNSFYLHWAAITLY
jgi:alpha-tubulin suppressor-like RCC1 family protein